MGSQLAGVVERTEARLAQVAAWMAEGMQPRAAAARAKEVFGLNRRQADAYVSASLRRMSQDNVLEPVESKRARVVAMLQDSIRSAKGRVRRYYDKDSESWESEPDPDHKAIATLTASLVTVEGLANPTAQASVLAQQEVERLLGALQTRLTPDQWAPVAAAVDAIRRAAAIVTER